MKSRRPRDLTRNDQPKKKQKIEKQYYDRFRIKGELFEIGDDVTINARQGEQKGRIIDIIQKGNHLYVNAMWYYSPSDLTNDCNINMPDYVGSAELFSSNHQQKVQTNCISGHIKVLDINTYTEQEEQDENVFFKRAQLDIHTKKIVPPMNQWTTICICEKPENPDWFYIGCDKWDDWFHPECIGMTESQGRQMKEYICKECCK